MYDGDGGRVKKSTVSGQQSTETTYIGSLYEVDSDGSIRKHIFAGANHVATMSLRGSEATEAISYFHSDHLGSSNVVTDSAGSQVGFTEFTPYGSISKQTGTYDPEHKFTGKELDQTGLYYYGARDYDAQLGRFTTADTIVQSPFDPQSLNRYSYCRNNPINYTDPTGHEWSWKKFWHSAAAGFVGGIVFALTGNPILAGMAGGAVYGGLSTGTISGALIGAGMGAIGGATLMVGGALFGSQALAGAIMLGVSAIQAYQAEGLEGLGYLAGGIAGGIAGCQTGNAIGNVLSRAGPSLANQRGSARISSEQKAANGLNMDQKPDISSSSGSKLITNYDVEDYPKSFDLINESDLVAYRQGQFADRSLVKGSEWAPKHPLTTPDYSNRFGLPAGNTGKPDWVVRGRVRGEYGLGEAPPGYNAPYNKGGDIEIRARDVMLDWFHMTD